MSQTAQFETIEAIKKGFMDVNRLPDITAKSGPSLVSEECEPQVSRWLADRLKRFAISYALEANISACLSEGVRPAFESVPSLLVDDKVILFRNRVFSHEQAIQAYDYSVIGLLGVKKYLAGNALFWAQLFDSLSQSQKDLMVSRYGLNLDDDQQRQMALEFYMADLAALNISLSFLQRRDSWQRSLLRKLYPKLKWHSQDLHYELLKLRRKMTA